MSKHQIGVGKANITYKGKWGIGMQGFMECAQKTKGVTLDLMSRAFVIVDNESKERVVIVIADIWSCSETLKERVLEMLSQEPKTKGFYSEKNVQISGTHTHSGPSGYSDYKVYRGPFMSNPKTQANREKMAEGIFNSIFIAHTNAVAGKIFFYTGTDNILKGCGDNRSKLAFEKNPPALKGASDTDKEMLLLKFENEADQSIGMINWFATHPTILGQTNKFMNGDIHGTAAYLFEQKIYKQPNADNFVGAFANSNCGDVSGNIQFGPIPRNFYKVPSEAERLDLLSNRLYKKAWDLFNNKVNFEEVTGDIQSAYLGKVNMVNYKIDETKLTTLPSFGLSTIAGSTEDGINTSYKKLMEGSTLGEPMDSYHLGAWRTCKRVLPIVLGLRKTHGIDELTREEFEQMSLDEKTQLILIDLELNAYAFNMDYINMQNIDMEEFKDGVSDASDWMKRIPWAITEEEEEDDNDNFAPLNEAESDDPYFDPKPIVIEATKAHQRMLPFSVPLQIFQLGNFVSINIPAELTTVAGRMLRSAMQNEFKNAGYPPIKHLALSCYSNAYAQYITTFYEYNAQHYEGASTLYGPYTLDAYIKLYKELALHLKKHS